MDSGPHSSMQSGPATGGTFRRGRGSRVVLARVSPNRSGWGNAQPTGCGQACQPLARRVGHDCAPTHAFSLEKAQFRDWHVRAAKMRRAAALLPREWWYGWTPSLAAGVFHADHDFDLFTAFNWDDLDLLSRPGQPPTRRRRRGGHDSVDSHPLSELRLAPGTRCRKATRKLTKT